MSAERKTRIVGRSVAKSDGMELACGAPLFCEDQLPPGCLHARVLRSSYAHARIVSLDVAPAEQLEGVAAVLHHGNVPRVMRTTAGQGAPEPSPYDFTTFDSKLRYVGDRVAAVAAETPELARQALGLIQLEVEQLPAIIDAHKAQAPGAVVIHDEPDARVVIPVTYEPQRNLVAHVDFQVGDVEKGLAAADASFDREYSCHYAQHAPIEPHCALAEPLANGRLRITTSTQVPFHVRRIVAQALQWPVSRIRVIKPRIGGGFGAKQEVLIEDLVAFLAVRSGRPVFLRLSRAEEFNSRTRHPMHIRLRTSVSAKGELKSVDMNVLSNTGAYGCHGLTVVCNCGSKVLPLYRWDDIRFWADVVYTNGPVAGAYRGYGATQAAFAMEVQMDEMARALGIDPVQFRLQNHIRSGETSPVFQALGEGGEGVAQNIGSNGLAKCLRQAAKEFGWRRRPRRQSKAILRRGQGMACLMQGSSIPEVDMGAASIKMNEDGSFNLLVGATDLGTGSDTILAQIAAEVLGVEMAQILVTSSDTDLTPFDVGAYASSTTYLSGEAVRKAAKTVAGQIRKVAANILGLPVRKLSLAEGQVVAADGQSLTLARIGASSLYEKDQNQIGAFASHTTQKSPPPFSAHFAEVEVDTETGLVRVLDYVAAVDCGTAINPALAEGQVEGAVANGLGYALIEEIKLDERGRLRNGSFREYKIPSTLDLPKIRVILVPTYEASGPYGAKSVSEIGINGPLPAIANAIFDAVGVRLRQAPFTPEKILAALKAAEQESS